MGGDSDSQILGLGSGSEARLQPLASLERRRLLCQGGTSRNSKEFSPLRMGGVGGVGGGVGCFSRFPYGASHPQLCRLFALVPLGNSSFWALWSYSFTSTLEVDSPFFSTIVFSWVFMVS